MQKQITITFTRQLHRTDLGILSFCGSLMASTHDGDVRGERVARDIRGYRFVGDEKPIRMLRELIENRDVGALYLHFMRLPEQERRSLGQSMEHLATRVGDAHTLDQKMRDLFGSVRCMDWSAAG